MAMTEEQGTTLLSRVSGGETVRDVLADMNITQDDFKAWRASHRDEFVAAKRVGIGGGKPGGTLKERKLARLNTRRGKMQSKIDDLDTKIAEAEAE